MLKETDGSGSGPGDKGYKCHCDDGEKELHSYLCHAIGSRVNSLKKAGLCHCSLLNCSKRRIVFFTTVIARIFAEGQFNGNVLMEQCLCMWQDRTHDPSFTESHIHYAYSPSAVPWTPNIHGIFLGINIDSRRLFASRMAVRLHVVSGLQNELALARDNCPKQTAGKGSFTRAVTDGAAGVRIRRSTEILEIVVRVRCRNVVCSNVLRSFDGGQQS